MYVRDARGGMRPVLADANHSQGNKTTSSWTARKTTTTSTKRVDRDKSPSRQGGLLVTRRDTQGSTGNITPSVFDTLPRADIGLVPPDRSRVSSRLSNPTLSRSVSQLNDISRSSSIRRYGNGSGRHSDEDSPNNENVYRHRQRSTSASRQRRRRTPSANRIQVYERPSSAAAHVDAPWKGGRAGYDNFSVVSEPVIPRRRAATPSRGLIGHGSVATGSTMMSSNQYLPAGSIRNGARSVEPDVYQQNSLGRATPTYANGYPPQHNMAPASNYGGRSSSMSRGMMGSRLLATPIPGGEVTAVDPELREAEKEGNQYYISMSLNAALSRPGFAGSVNTLDQMDNYTTMNGSRSRLDTGYPGSRLGLPDEGLHASRLDVVDYNPVMMMMPDRPASRAVSVVQIGRDVEMLDSASVMGSYYNDTLRDEDSYVVKSVTATRPRTTSRMSTEWKSMERLNGEEKVEFDLELIGTGGAGRKIVGTGHSVKENGVIAGGLGSSQGQGSYTFQETLTSRQRTNFPPGPEPRFTMKLNDTLLMDYLPNEGQTEAEIRQETTSWYGSERSDVEREEQRRRDREEEEERARRERERREEEEERRRLDLLERERLAMEKRRLENEMEAERRRLERERQAMEEEKRKAEEERRRAEEERRKLEDERRRQKEMEEAERKRKQREMELMRLEDEKEKERQRKRRQEELERDRERQRLQEELERERQRLEKEKEKERERRLEEERERQRQSEQRERERRRQEEMEKERKRREAEEKERERQRREAEEKERLRREAEEKEKQRREAEERERQRREAEERERKRREAEEKEKERQRNEAEKRRRQEEEARRRELELERQREEEEERERERNRREEEDRRRKEEEKRRKEAEDRRRRQEEEEERERQRQEEEAEEAERRFRENERRKLKEEKEKEEERKRKKQQADDEARRKSRPPSGGLSGPMSRPMSGGPMDSLDGPQFDTVDQSHVSRSYASRDYNDDPDDDFNTNITINRGDSPGRDAPDESWVRQRANDFAQRLPVTKDTSDFVKRLMKDAPPNSVRQRVDVEREEEEIRGPLPTKTEGLLNLDTVSEKVNMILVDGNAELTVKVRCERIVPIRGATDLYKKSSVIVSRIIDVDLTVTQERRDLYEQVMENRREENRISNQDTFELYKAFMELAEAEEALGGGAPPVDQRVRIDKRVDEERFLDLQRERKAFGRPGDEDFVGLYEPGLASADFDTDDVMERREARRVTSSRNQSYRSDRPTDRYTERYSERHTGGRPSASIQRLHPRTQHGKRYVRRTGPGLTIVHDSDTSSMR